LLRPSVSLSNGPRSTSSNWAKTISLLRTRSGPIAPGGRSCDGVGSCDSHEERFEESVWKKGADGKSYKEPTGKYKWKYNDVDGTAYTRAANRAISDLVGGGEVSAEEMSGVKDVTPAVSEPEYLEQRYQDRLLTVAKDRGEEGINKLARLIFNQLGSRFLTKEQAVEIGKQLQAGPSPDKKNQEPANSVDPARSKAAEVFEDAVVTEVPAPGSRRGPGLLSGRNVLRSGDGPHFYSLLKTTYANTSKT
jgi:hypothetical protein